jgi:hypothetical protein
MQVTKHSLRMVIDEWVEKAQENDHLDMWISATLIDSMTDAAWAVLRESRKTQKWMQEEDVLEEIAAADRK